MKKFILAFIALGLSSQLAFASRPMPAKCPSVSAIQNVPIMNALELFGGYFASSMDNFGTDDYWMFIEGIIESDSVEHAIKAGNQLKKKLSGQPIPQAESTGNEWSCVYSLPGDMIAQAITSDSLLSPAKVAKHFSK